MDAERPRRSPRDVRREVDEELRFHLEMRRRELLAAGFSEAAADDEARRRFGDLDLTRRRCTESQLRKERRMRRREVLADLVQDLAVGWRALARRPGFAAAAVLVLALGLGASLAVFTVADHVALRPLPYRDAERVVTIFRTDPAAGEERGLAATGDFLDWQETARAFSALGLAEPFGFDLTGDGPPEPLPALLVTGGWFAALGVEPLGGRLPTAEDFAAAGPAPVLISESLWRRRFGADPGLVGRTIELDGAPTPVIGVLPDGVAFPEPVSVWAPKLLRPGERDDQVADYRHAIGRLAPGVGLEQAQHDLDRVAALSAERHPRTHAGRGLAAIRLPDVVLGPVRPALHLLLAAAGLLLAIACANVAGLLLARGGERQTELAVRGALGAGRGRLARQLLTESLLLAALGGAAGLGLAALATPLLVRLLPPDLPRAAEIALDGRVLAVGLALTLATGLVAGLAPALRLARPPLAAALHAGGRASEDPRRARVRQALVVAEIALALVLLVTSGLLMRSFERLLDNDLGFAHEGRLALQLFLWDRNPTAAARAARVDEISSRLAALPGVEEVGVVSALPFHPSAIDIETEVRVEGRPRRPGEGAPTAFATVASPGYFRALGIPLLSGRGFGVADRDGAPSVALVNRTLARRMFGGGDPRGERLAVGEEGRLGTVEIVGVVGDVRSKGFDSEPRPELYVPYAQARTGHVTFVVAAAGEAAPLLPLAQQAVWDVDPQQTISASATLADYVAGTIAERRFLLLLVASFSAVALLLAAVGTFALVSYSVAQRGHEMAIRRALGAPPRTLVASVLGQAARLGLPGVAVGLLLAATAGGALRPLLYQVAPSDPGTLVPVAALMLAVTLLGAWLPARRAAAADPATALRQV